MNIKQVIVSSIFWRGLYFASVLLINIIVSRFFQAAGTGWIYYITNFFSFIILIGSLSLETGMTYYGSGRRISSSKLAVFGILWSLVVSMVVIGLLWSYYHHPTQTFTRSQFIFFASTYVTGVLLTTFFCALFYADRQYAIPNFLMVITNLLLAGLFIIDRREGGAFFLRLYFLNFLVQGVFLAGAYCWNMRHQWSWKLPDSFELKQLFRFSLLALSNNVIFFLLYRIDYWFIKNICQVCHEGDLGNYIQASKMVQMFLVLPGILASAVFPLTAGGKQNAMNRLLPLLSRSLFACYIAILFLLSLTGYWLFPWVFGGSFDKMYVPFLVMMPGIVALSIVALLTAYNSGRYHVTTNMKGSIIGLAIIVVGDSALIPRFGIRAAALVSSTGYSIYFLYLLLKFKSVYGVSLSSFFMPEKSDWMSIRRAFSSVVNDNYGGK